MFCCVASRYFYSVFFACTATALPVACERAPLPPESPPVEPIVNDGLVGCQAPVSPPLLSAGAVFELPAVVDFPSAMAFSKSGKGYFLSLTGLWRWDPAASPAITLVTDDIGVLPPYSFQTTLEVYDDDHIYWNQGGGIRGFERGAIVDHFSTFNNALLDVHVVSPRELWAVGYDSLLLHEVDGVAEAIDLLSHIEPRPDDAALQLWDLVPTARGLAVVGTGAGTFGTLDGTVGIVGFLEDGVWRASAIDTRPAFAFLNFAAATCDDKGLVLGGDFALHGVVDFEFNYTHLAGGTLAQDLLISDLVVSCGGKTYVGVGVPGTSAISELSADPPAVVGTDDEVPGFISAGACHDGRLYVLDAWTAPPTVRVYR